MFVVDKPHDVDKEAKWMIKPIEALQSDIQASNSLFGLVSEASPLTQHRGPPPQHLRSPIGLLHAGRPHAQAHLRRHRRAPAGGPALRAACGAFAALCYGAAPHDDAPSLPALACG